MDNNKLVRQQQGLSTTAQISSQDLALGRLLDLAGQVFRQEVLPGEVRVWSETFKTERPEMIEAGFMEYFKEGKFFPKPADIRAAIALMRGAVVSNFVSVDQEALAMEKSTPEYQALAKEISDKWKRWGGIITMEGGEAAKKPRPTFRSALASEEPASSGGDDLENSIV